MIRRLLCSLAMMPTVPKVAVEGYSAKSPLPGIEEIAAVRETGARRRLCGGRWRTSYVIVSSSS